MNAEGRFWKATPGHARTPDDKHDDELAGEALTRPPMFPAWVYGMLSLGVTALAAWLLATTWTDVRYAARVFGGEAVDLGDLRVRHRTEARLDLPSDTHVKFTNAIVTYEAGSAEGGYNFFYSPLYRLIVRTKRDFPPKRTGHTFQVEDHLVEMIGKHEIEPVDLSSGFDGEGRLYRATELPEVAKSLLTYYAPGIRAPLEEVYVVLDGETPAAAWPYLALWLVALGTIGMNVRVLARMARARRQGR